MNGSAPSVQNGRVHEPQGLCALRDLRARVIGLVSRLKETDSNRPLHSLTSIRVLTEPRCGPRESKFLADSQQDEKSNPFGWTNRPQHGIPFLYGINKR